jgi:hypothetical protein
VHQVSPFDPASPWTGRSYFLLRTASDQVFALSSAFISSNVSTDRQDAFY